VSSSRQARLERHAAIAAITIDQRPAAAMHDIADIADQRVLSLSSASGTASQSPLRLWIDKI